MRNPARKAAIYAVPVLAGISAAGFAIGRPAGTDGDPLALGAWIFAMAVTPFSFACLAAALLHVRGRAKLLEGTSVVARWHVSTAEWDLFRTFDKARSADPAALVNDLGFARHMPFEGIHVIVGEKSALIGDSYHVLRRRGLPELRAIGWLAPDPPTPECIEFHVAYPRGRYGGSHFMALRFPVPRTARAEGIKVYEWFAPRLPPQPAIALRNPRRTLQVCLMLLVLAAMGLGWSWLAAQAAGWSLDETVLPLVVMISSAMLALFAVILGGLTLLLKRKDEQ